MISCSIIPDPDDPSPMFMSPMLTSVTTLSLGSNLMRLKLCILDRQRAGFTGAFGRLAAYENHRVNTTNVQLFHALPNYIVHSTKLLNMN